MVGMLFLPFSVIIHKAQGTALSISSTMADLAYHTHTVPPRLGCNTTHDHHFGEKNIDYDPKRSFRAEKVYGAVIVNVFVIVPV